MTQPRTPPTTDNNDNDNLRGHHNGSRLATTGEPGDTPFWKVPPLHRRDVGVMAACYVALTAVYLAVGWMLVNWWDPSSLGAAEADVNRWFEDRRTDTRTDLAHLGSAFSNTETKVALVLALLPLMLWMFRRWHEWALITGGLIFEVSVFGSTAKIIGRDRPPVEQLDGAPTNSWPSGHIAACIVFYFGLAIVIWWNPRFRGSGPVAFVLATLTATAVTVSRLYLGMHYVSDVVGGVVLGVLTLLLMRHLLLRSDTWSGPASDGPLDRRDFETQRAVPSET